MNITIVQNDPDFRESYTARFFYVADPSVFDNDRVDFSWTIDLMQFPLRLSPTPCQDFPSPASTQEWRLVRLLDIIRQIARRIQFRLADSVAQPSKPITMIAYIPIIATHIYQGFNAM